MLFGVSCMGKSTVGKLVAESLAWRFYNLDEEVKRRRGTTLEEFVKTGSLGERDNYRAEVINQQPTGQDPGYESESISCPC